MQSKILISLVGYLPCETNEPVNRQPLPDLNPLTPKTQTSILIPPYNITPESHIKVLRMKQSLLVSTSGNV